jgi:hypothetical protein
MRSGRTQSRTKAAVGNPLDATALEAVDRFVRVLGRCGCAAPDILAAFAAACERLPTPKMPVRSGPQREISNAPHILTLWFSDALYVDRTGAPIALPLRGPAPSLEALVERVDSALKVEEAAGYLLRSRTVIRRGARYVPRRRALSLRGAQGAVVFRNLRSLVGLLRTLENNLQPKRTTRSWFEYSAENHAFPASARVAFDERLDELAMKFLQTLDADMHRRESERSPSEKTVHVGVGVYRFEDTEPLRAAPPGRRRGGQRRRVR